MTSDTSSCTFDVAWPVFGRGGVSSIPRVTSFGKEHLRKYLIFVRGGGFHPTWSAAVRKEKRAGNLGHVVMDGDVFIFLLLLFFIRHHD